ncbi:hypothetical protein L6164_002408 [Bauhinia variegata]|uniref:Uncharacterized protein n=1 Tax=Bauhinia variegata TaxID=167791 RepID=A0ACB9PXB7_BAUVA|nr:hypothetical protein L6164_002408 [Bauhinia variegata]
MDYPPFGKIAISGPILAAMIQSFSTSAGAVDGLIFGHVTHVTTSNLSDDSESPADSNSSTFIATITGFFCSGTVNSFYDNTGTIESGLIGQFLDDPLRTHQSSLLGWFSGRRKTQLRPSMRERLVTTSLATDTQFSFPVKNALEPTDFKPCLFLLFASPPSDQIIHTHEYRAYQFRSCTDSFESKSISIVNIGPAFGGHYGSFSSNSPFPSLPCELHGSPMNEDKDHDRNHSLKDQRELDMCAEGFEVGRLRKMVGSEATNYTWSLEDLYEKMLVKMGNLAIMVEDSSAKLCEQEKHNRELRYKISKLVASE